MWFLIGLIIIFLIIVIITMYNTLVSLKRKYEQSASGIEVYCQQRFDLIPNLVETVKEYAKYEKQTLESITSLRTKYNDTKDLAIGEELNNKMNNLIALVENYPELKASEQFLNLQKSLVKTENQLQAARRIYNIDVTKYNTKISVVPYNIIAKIFKFKPAKLFEIEDKSNMENVDVEL